MTSRWMSPVEDRAWRGYRRMFTLLEARLARDLAEESGLSVADYSVLSNLVEAEGRRWRLTELAEHMRWSQSRLSHHIARMEKRGLVVRRPSERDGRGTTVLLTRAGLQVIAEATPGHMRAVRRHMLDLLTPDQLGSLGEIADVVVAHLSEEGDTS